ncbi:MAG: hypothetical protein E1N59_2408 [Puniceicoccaceae bacterium 5H]|nr:MAG: hypothetical protein E1N59_2408 [Puniceicoccaceae bacterium 5H]
MDTKRLLSLLKQYPIVTIGLLLSVIFGLVVYFRHSQVSALDSQIRTAEQQYQVMLRNVANAKSLEEQIETVKGYNEQLDGRLIDRRDLTRNLNYFYDFEKKFDLKITSLSQVGGITPATPADYLPKLEQFDIVRFSVSVEGSYSSVVRWLKYLENGRYFISIGELSLSQRNDPTDRSLVQMNVQIDVLGSRPPSQ